MTCRSSKTYLICYRARRAINIQISAGESFPKAHISGREALVANILEAANDGPHAQAEPVDSFWLKRGLRLISAPAMAAHSGVVERIIAALEPLLGAPLGA